MANVAWPSKFRKEVRGKLREECRKRDVKFVRKAGVSGNCSRFLRKCMNKLLEAHSKNRD